MFLLAAASSARFQSRESRRCRPWQLSQSLRAEIDELGTDYPRASNIWDQLQAKEARPLRMQKA